MATTVTVNGNQVTFTLDAPLTQAGDFALFCFGRPGKSQASVMPIPAEIMASVDAWIRNQTYDDGSPKYAHLGDLIKSNEIATTFQKIITAYPTATVQAAIDSAATAAAGIQTAIEAAASEMASL